MLSDSFGVFVSINELGDIVPIEVVELDTLDQQHFFFGSPVCLKKDHIQMIDDSVIVRNFFEFSETSHTIVSWPCVYFDRLSDVNIANLAIYHNECFVDVVKRIFFVFLRKVKLVSVDTCCQLFYNKFHER